MSARIGWQIANQPSGASTGQIEDWILAALGEITLSVVGVNLQESKLTSGGYLPAYTLTLLPETLLVEEKITALLTRGKPRDYFDLYFLLRKGLITPAMKPKLEIVRGTLQESKPNFSAELAQFLAQLNRPGTGDLVVFWARAHQPFGFAQDNAHLAF